MATVRKPLLIIAIAVCFFTIGGAVAYAWQHAKIGKLNHQVSALNGEVGKLTKQNDLLTDKLNTANKVVARLTAGQSFEPGAPCQTQQLALAEEPDSLGAGAGNRYDLFSYQNTSSSSCTIKGFPGFLALDQTGYVMPNGPVQTNGTPNTLTLGSNDKAYFLLHWTVVDSPSKCIDVSLIESTPPGNTYPLILSMNNFNVCGPFIDVSALGPLSQYSQYLHAH